jgi:hypothetical protein
VSDIIEVSVVLWLLRTLHGRGLVLVHNSILVPRGMAYIIDENMVVDGDYPPIDWPPGDPTLRDSLRTGAVPRWGVV